MRLPYSLFLCLILGTLMGNAIAHQQKAAITTVLFNQNSGNLEVMHRFLLHDAEHGVKILFGKGANILTKEETQQTFTQYVTSKFSITDLQGQSLPLTLVGHDIEGSFFWVYQEVPISDWKGLRIKHTTLQEIWSKQINTINIEGKGAVQTMHLDQFSNWQQIVF